MKKQLLEIKQADELVAGLYAKNPKLQNGKFGYAWKKFTDKNYNPTMTELNDKFADNRVDNALTDPITKELLIGADKNYKFGKEGMKALLAANRKLMEEYDKKEIEVIPYFVKEEDLPEMLEEERKQLKGLVIEEIVIN